MDATALERSHTANLVRLLSFADLDARTAPYRRVNVLARRIERDLGSDLSTAQQALVLRAATLITLCEHSEVCLLTGRDASLADYLQAANTLKRLLATLGLKRQPRDITPDPLAYAAERDEAAP